MSLGFVALIFIGGLFLLLVLGMEMAVAMGVIASLGFVFILNHSQADIAWTAWSSLNSSNLIAMPLFIFMGAMLANSGAIRSLLHGAEKLLGSFPGGLTSMVIVGNALFGAMSGSSIAAATIFSSFVFPEMEEKGYDHKLALGSIAVGGTLAVLIPPSIILIIFGVWENQSIARLFAAALLPGILLSLLLLATIVVMVKLNPRLVPKSPRVPWREKLAAIKDILPWMGLIVLVLGVIFGGVMTPTEASALGAFLSIVIAVGYRRMSYHALKESLLATVRVTAMIGFILFTARLIAFVFLSAGLSDVFASFIVGLPLGKYGIFAVVCVMYLVLGMFFDATSMLLLTTPFIMPVILHIGYDPIWWGVVYVILAQIGMVTPPFGLNLFAMQAVLPRYSILTIAQAALPFLIPTLLAVVILAVFPQIALWLPGILY